MHNFTHIGCYFTNTVDLIYVKLLEDEIDVRYTKSTLVYGSIGVRSEVHLKCFFITEIPGVALELPLVWWTVKQLNGPYQIELTYHSWH